MPLTVTEPSTLVQSASEPTLAPARVPVTMAMTPLDPSRVRVSTAPVKEVAQVKEPDACEGREGAERL